MFSIFSPAKRLTLFGLDNLERIGRLTRRHLTAQFGEEGEKVYDLLDPQREDPLIFPFRPAPAVVRFLDFETEAIEPAEILPALLVLLTRRQVL